MAKITPFLFSWQEIEVKSDMTRLKMVLEHLPDEALMKKLEARRGKGRNDYPVRCMWNAMLAGIVFQHDSIEKLRRELSRNAELRQICGFDPFRGSKAVPPPEAFTHFFRSLAEHFEEVDRIFTHLLEQAGELLRDLGYRMGIDSKGIRSGGRPTKKEKRDGRRDLDADWGVKEYKGNRLDGSEWKTIKKWFGYKVHLLVDTTHEIPLEYEVTRASASDVKQLRPTLKKLEQRSPEIFKRARILSADKAYDDGSELAWLYDEKGIKPVIDIRNTWREAGNESLRIPGQPVTRQLYPYDADNIVYDIRGNVYCYCFKTHKHQSMAFGGYDKERESLKYICPVKAYGMSCHCQTECPHRKGSIRIPLSVNRRIFTPIARSSYKWEREYRYRTGVERVNSRLDVSFGFENHTIRGLTKMKIRISLAMIVMLSMAVGHIKEGRKQSMRSLVRGPWPARQAA